MTSKTAKTRKKTTFVQEKVRYSVNDTVLVRADKSVEPFIGKIKEIRFNRDEDEDLDVVVAWWYRPEEAVGGRKPFHGAKELFGSDHLDTISSLTIIGHAYVHSLKEYEALEKKTPADFFTRFSYKPSQQQFEPDRVPIYCTCEQPYNPDLPMVMCDKCEEWYHCACIQANPQIHTPLTPSAAEHYLCYMCAGPPAQPSSTAGAKRELPVDDSAPASKRQATGGGQQAAAAAAAEPAGSAAAAPKYLATGGRAGAQEAGPTTAKALRA